jgi:hypothetical protein
MVKNELFPIYFERKVHMVGEKYIWLVVEKSSE